MPLAKRPSLSCRGCCYRGSRPDRWRYRGQTRKQDGDGKMTDAVSWTLSVKETTRPRRDQAERRHVSDATR